MDVPGWMYLVQREEVPSGGHVGRVAVQGRWGLAGEKLQAAWVTSGADSVRAEAWYDISPERKGRNFSVELALPSESPWSFLWLRSCRGEKRRVAVPVTVGLSELFIVAGQSNAAGWSQTLFAEQRARVYSGDVERTGRITWRACADPQVPGGGGSWLPLAGVELASSLGRPVGFLNVAVPSSHIRDWQPYTAPWRKLVAALRATAPGGVRAILWQQGESDEELSAAEYKSFLETLISSVQRESGLERPVPWLIARASKMYGVNSASVRQAQEAVCDGRHVMRGPDADALGLEFRESDGSHFNERGTRAMAHAWAKSIQEHFFSEIKTEAVSKKRIP